MGIGNFSSQLDAWLANFHLSGDPFALFEADQEKDLLSKFFVDRPYLHNILGDPAHPQTAILKADRGEGKTATREMIAYECLHGKLSRRALPIRYYQFDHLLQQVDFDPSRVTLQHHINSIARLALRQIVETVPAAQIRMLPEEKQDLLKDFLETFGDPPTRLIGQRILERPALGLDLKQLTPRENLEYLGSLVTSLPITPSDRSLESPPHYCSLYILIDRVDESGAGLDAALSILAPLVSQGPLLNMPDVAFKFFLPNQIGDAVIQKAAVPRDRMRIEQITWTEENLREMIDQRILYYSNGYLSHLEQLCSPNVRGAVFSRLIDASGRSPRSVLRLCSLFIHSHVERELASLGGDHLREVPSSASLDRLDLADAIIKFKQQNEAQSAPVDRKIVPEIAAPALDTEPRANPPDYKGLFLDTSGRVLIDGQPLDTTLSEQELSLLKILLKFSPQVVPSDELIRTVWRDYMPVGEMGDNHYADRQNLRKLVTRLRRRLEPEGDGKTSRFIKNAHGRGYWIAK